jgi:hypothetical protein
MTAGNETFTERRRELTLGTYPLLAEPATIASGEGALSPGAVLGKVTATGQYRLSLAASEDGSEVPSKILAVHVNATSAAADAPVWASGLFEETELTLGTGHDVDAVHAAFDGTPLFIRKALVLQD